MRSFRRRKSWVLAETWGNRSRVRRGLKWCGSTRALPPAPASTTECSLETAFLPPPSFGLLGINVTFRDTGEPLRAWKQGLLAPASCSFKLHWHLEHLLMRQLSQQGTTHCHWHTASVYSVNVWLEWESLLVCPHEVCPNGIYKSPIQPEHVQQYLCIFFKHNF